MRSRTVLLALALVIAVSVAPLTSLAQQQPIHGCGTAISCRPLGFSTLGPSGTGSVGFGVGLAFEPGFQIHIVAPPTPTPAAEKFRIFHRGVSLLPPTPVPTPTPKPPPAAAPNPGSSGALRK